MSASPRPRKVYQWRPTMPSGRVLDWLLVTAGAFAFLDGLFRLIRASSATSLTASRADLLAHTRSISSPIGFVSGPVVLACEVLWLIWQHKVHADLWARGAPGLRFTPGWAVGWWFVPFANYVQPVRAVRELSNHVGRDGQSGSDKRPAVSAGLLASWWGSYVVSSLLALVALVIWIRTTWAIIMMRPLTTVATIRASDLRAIAWWWGTSSIVRGVAALLAARIVWAISRAENAAPLLAGIPPRPDL